MSDNDEPFLARWSRRKRGLEPAAPAIDTASAAPVAAVPEGTDTAEPACPEQRMLTETDFADVDFEALDFASDYGRFMGANVPDAIRNRALRKLWVSDPVLANMDGLHDYFGDYTDAAVAVPAGKVLQTAYKYGQGFLSDEEAAVWDRLGKPVEIEKPKEVVAASAVEEKQPDQEQRPGEGTEGTAPEVAAVPTADDNA